jgi:putative alpha-1,2-mannosidase
LGLTDVAADYYNRSQFYRNIWSEKDKFFCAKKTTGELVCPVWLEHLYVWDKKYTEGDSWHYRFYVTHDPKGLI